MPRAGLRFKPLLGPEMRIPGTERIAEGLQKATTAGRLRLTDTALGRTARKLGAGRSEELRQAYEALALGGTPTMSPRTGANMIRKVRAGQLAGRGVSHAAEREAVDLGTKLRDNVDFTHAYEEGLDTGEEGARLKGMGEFLLKEQKKHGVNVGDWKTAAENPAGLEYLPHIYTDEGAELVGLTPPPGGGGTIDPLSTEAQQHARKLVPGKYIEFQGKGFMPKTGSIREFNDWAMQNFGIKMFRDDPEYLIARMVEDAAKASERAAGLGELKTGAARELFSETDPRATRQVAVANPDEVIRMEAGQGAATKARAATQDELDVLGEQVKGRLVEQFTGLNEAALANDVEARAAYQAATQGVKDAETAQRQLVRTNDRLLAEAKTEVGKARKVWDAANKRIDDLEVRLRGEGWEAYNAAMTREMAARDVAQRKLDRLMETVRQRDIVRKQLGRRQARLPGVQAADEAVQTALPGPARGCRRSGAGRAPSCPRCGTRSRRRGRRGCTGPGCCCSGAVPDASGVAAKANLATADANLRKLAALESQVNSPKGIPGYSKAQNEAFRAGIPAARAKLETARAEAQQAITDALTAKAPAAAVPAPAAVAPTPAAAVEAPSTLPDELAEIAAREKAERGAVRGEARASTQQRRGLGDRGRAAGRAQGTPRRALRRGGRHPRRHQGDPRGAGAGQQHGRGDATVRREGRHPPQLGEPGVARSPGPPREGDTGLRPARRQGQGGHGRVRRGAVRRRGGQDDHQAGGGRRAERPQAGDRQPEGGEQAADHTTGRVQLRRPARRHEGRRRPGSSTTTPTPCSTRTG